MHTVLCPLPAHVCAPAQVLSRKLYLPAVKSGAPHPPKIVAVDLQPMAPVEGVVQLQGDITSEVTAAQASPAGCPGGGAGRGAGRGGATDIGGDGRLLGLQGLGAGVVAGLLRAPAA